MKSSETNPFPWDEAKMSYQARNATICGAQDGILLKLEYALDLKLKDELCTLAYMSTTHRGRICTEDMSIT